MAGMPPWSVPAGTISGLKGLDLSPWFQNEQLNFQRQMAQRQHAQAQQAMQLDMQAQKAAQDYREKIANLELKAAGEQAEAGRKERMAALDLKAREGEAQRELQARELDLRQRDIEGRDQLKAEAQAFKEQDAAQKQQRQTSIDNGKAQARAILGNFPGPEGLQRAYDQAMDLFPHDDVARAAYLATLEEVEATRGKVSALKAKEDATRAKTQGEASAKAGRAAARTELGTDMAPERVAAAIAKADELFPDDVAARDAYLREIETAQRGKASLDLANAGVREKEINARLKATQPAARAIKQQLDIGVMREREKAKTKQTVDQTVTYLQAEVNRLQAQIATDPRAAAQYQRYSAMLAQEVARAQELERDIQDILNDRAQKQSDMDALAQWVRSGEGAGESVYRKWIK